MPELGGTYLWGGIVSGFFAPIAACRLCGPRNSRS